MLKWLYRIESRSAQPVHCREGCLVLLKIQDFFAPKNTLAYQNATFLNSTRSEPQQSQPFLQGIIKL